jgi:hypothetical protein
MGESFEAEGCVAREAASAAVKTAIIAVRTIFLTSPPSPADSSVGPGLNSD